MLSPISTLRLLRADRLGTEVHHHQPGGRPVGQRLLNPFPAVPQTACFQQDAGIAAMPFKLAGVGLASRHADLTHDRMKEMALTRLSVIGGAARNGVLQVGSFQDLLCPERVQSFLSQPAVQDLDHPVPQHGRFHHSAIEQDVRGTRQSTAATPDAGRLGTIANLLRQEAREVLGDGWIGAYGRPNS